jgi:hypothetical protein
MADDLREYMQAEIFVMMKEIGARENSESAFFTQKALEWIEKNAADFRMRWDAKKRRIVGRPTRKKVKQHDVE